MANVQLFRHSKPKFAEKPKVNKRQTWAMNVDKVQSKKCRRLQGTMGFVGAF